MSYNVSCDVECLGSDSFSNTSSSSSTGSTEELSFTSSAISMTVGIVSNSLALFILLKAYHRFRLKSKASFLFFASGLVVTDFFGHLINGSLALYVYMSHKEWEIFDPKQVLCGFFGVCMTFFGLSPLILGSVMAVERCIGVTQPLFHTTALASHHMKKLLVFTWLLALLIALLPVFLCRPYQVQSSRSWCFFRMVGARDWLDIFLPMIFSGLGLLSLFVSFVCNTTTGLTLLQTRCQRDRSHWRHRKSSSHHFEMICQLLAIMLVSCVCWGPFLVNIIILSTRDQSQEAYARMLLTVRLATWNQILDPWIYILLRKAVLRKLFLLTKKCCGCNSETSHRWKCSILKGSVETSTTVSGRPDCICMNGPFLPDTIIKPIPRV
ncbi:prostaglandin F2-alpha receptor [Chanos chanos]|uniref:Prostaglandin F2-alpha receptor n=1 Tax=Chanos chanos TaxID=29144 RepID=A0A6J2WTY2_CHACN|nr:prostaglandin F2-alpha receptor [Chanos chanos]